MGALGRVAVSYERGTPVGEYLHDHLVGGGNVCKATLQVRRNKTGSRGTGGLESRVPGSGFRVPGFGVRDSGFRFRVSGFGFRVSGFGYRKLQRRLRRATTQILPVTDLPDLPASRPRLRFGFRVSGFGFRVSGFGFQFSDFGFRVSRSGLQVSGSAIRVPGVRFRVSGF